MARERSIMQPFYSMVLEGMITNGIEWRVLSFILIWVNFIQITSYSLLRVGGEGESNLQSGDFPWYEGYKVLFLAVRPSLIIQYYKISTLEIPAFIISILIPVFLVFGFIVLICVRAIQEKIQSSSSGGSSEVKKENNKSKSYLELLITISSLFNYGIFVIITDILVSIGILGSISGEQSFGTGIRIIGLIFSVLALAFNIVASLFLEQSMGILEYNLNRTQTTNISVTINILKYGIVVMGAFRQNSPNTILDASVQALVITYYVLSFIDYFTVIPFSSFSKSRIYLSALTICGFSSMVAPFYITIDLISSQTLASICLVTLPLLTAGLVSRQIEIEGYLLFEVFQNEVSFSKTDMKYLEKKVSLFYNNKEQLIENHFLKVLAQINRHRDTCNDLYCFCKSGQSVCKGSDESNFIIDGMQVEKYLRYLCRVDLNRTRSEREDFHSQFIRYMDFFSRSQKQRYSIQCIIDLLNESDRMRKDMSAFKEASLRTMLDIIKKSMKDAIFSGISDNETEKMTKAADNYILYEKEKDSLKAQILSCLNYKIESYEKVRKSFEDISELEEINFKMNQKYIGVEKQLQRLFIRFPNKKTQNFLCFFLAELMNSFKKALDISKQIRFSNYAGDFTLLFKNDVMDIFRPDVISATVTMGKVWGKIQRVSDQLPDILGYKKHEFQYVNHIKEIMPSTVAKIHDNLIKYLMTTGQDNILHERRDLFLKKRNNFLLRAQVFISINLHFKEELPYITFARVLPTKSGFFVINELGIIEGMDSSVLEKLGFTGAYQIQCLPGYISIEIKNCFESYESLLSEIDPKTCFLEKEAVQFKFPSVLHPAMVSLITYSNSQSKEEEKNNTKSNDETKQVQPIGQSEENSFEGIKGNVNGNGNSKIISKIRQIKAKATNEKASLFNSFTVDINIEKRDLHVLTGKYTYYVIEIKSAIPQNQQFVAKEDPQGSLLQNGATKLNQEPQKNRVSMKGNYKTGQQNLINNKNVGSQIDHSFDSMNVEQIKMDSQVAKSKNSSMSKVPEESIDIQGEGKRLDFSLDLREAALPIPTPVVGKIKKHQDKKKEMKGQDNSQLQVLINNKQSAETDSSGEMESSIEQIQELTSINRKEVKANIKGDGRNEGSVASSASSISRNLDKYNYFEDFLKASNMPFSIKLVGWIRLAEYAVLLLTSIIVMIIIYNSFDTLISSITLVTFSSQISFYYYNTLSFINNFIVNAYTPQTLFDQEFTQLVPRIQEQRANLTNHYSQLYQDTQLTKYFTEETVEFIQPYQTQSTSIQLYIAIEQILQHFKILERMTSTELQSASSNVSYIFVNDNFVPLVQYFEDVSSRQLQEIKEFLDSQISSLVLMIILLNLCTLMVYAISLATYRKIEGSIKMLMKIIQNVNLLHIETELDRMKQLSEDIAESENVMLEYTFNLKIKEQQTIRAEIAKNKKNQRDHWKSGTSSSTSGSSNRQKMNVQIQKESLRISRFYFFAISIYLVFLTYSLLSFSLSSSFIDSFGSAITCFSSISDAVLYLPLITTMQVFLYQNQKESSELAYISATHINMIQQQLYEPKLQRIVGFQSVVESVYSLSIFDSDFQNSLYSYLTQNICSNILVQDSQFEKNCPTMYSGQLVKGSSATFNFLYSKFFANLKEKFASKMDTSELDNIALVSSMTSYQIQTARDFFSSHLSSLTQNEKTTILLISLVYIIAVTIPQIYLGLIELPRIFERFLMSKKLILFVPPQTLLIEDSFIKILKAISNNLKITD